MVAVKEKTYECPKCAREFGSRGSLARHRWWCGKDRTETRRKIAEAARNPSPEARQKMSEWQRGKKKGPRSTETRRKISSGLRGKKLSVEALRKRTETRRRNGVMCGPNNPNWKGGPQPAWCAFCGDYIGLIKYNEATGQTTFRGEKRRHFCRSKDCLALWTSAYLRGANHPRWKGGCEPFYGPDWPGQRDCARNRDNYTCQRCGLTEGQVGHEVSVHHIRPFRESKDNSTENLICLCDTNDNGCHLHCEHNPEDCPDPRKHWLLPAVV